MKDARNDDGLTLTRARAHEEERVAASIRGTLKHLA
jgi:hypothetical protein